MITEGGARELWKKRRKETREVPGTGKGRAIQWNRKTHRNFAQCRTGKGRIGKWKHQLDPWMDPEWRDCGEEEETGSHIALVCRGGESRGRRWSTEQIDEKERWKKEKIGDSEVTVDLVEDFFTWLNL